MTPSERPAWTPERVRGLGVVTDVETASSVLNIGRTPGYRQAKAGTFPVPVLRVGRLYRVPVSGLLAALGLNPAPTHQARTDSAA